MQCSLFFCLSKTVVTKKVAINTWAPDILRFTYNAPHSKAWNKHGTAVNHRGVTFITNTLHITEL